MAGNYNDPETRLHYDVLGLRSWRKAASGPTTALVEDTSFLGNMNNESGGDPEVLELAWNSADNPGHTPYIILEFPRLVDIDSMMTYGGSEGSFTVEYSNLPLEDISSWSAGEPMPTTGDGDSLKEWAREEEPTEQLITDVRTLRISAPMGGGGSSRTFGKILLFGAASDVAGPAGVGSLTFWHPTLNQRAVAADVEFGDIARTSTQTKQLRVKNESPDLTAKTVEFSLSHIETPSPPTTSFYEFSLNQITWTSSLDIGDLAPETISAIVYIRQQLPANATLGLWWVRLSALADFWEE